MRTQMSRDLPRTVGFWGAIGIMIGVTIGSGIFRQPASIAQHLGSPAMVLVLWGVGGLLSLFGALTYAELATVYPRSGGIYNYLANGLGRGLAFVFGWTYMVITKPFAAAGIAVLFAEQVNILLGVRWNIPVVVCVWLTLLTALNVLGMRLGAGVSLVFSVLKVLALVVIVGVAAAMMKGGAEHFRAEASPKPLLAALAPVMLAILWTYDGWSDVGSISGEVKDPQRMLPRIFFIGTSVVIVLYLVVNAVYLWVVPLAEMRALEAVDASGAPNTVARVVMERLVGPAGGMIVTIMILVSTLGATHASIITGARVTFAQAQDRLLFQFLGRIHPKYKTPAVALWSQLVFSCAAVLMQGGSFSKLADGFTFTMWIFYGLAAIAVIVLRVKRPDLPRTYKCWGYPFVPGVFIAASVGMTALSIIGSPRDTLPWIAVLLAGAPVYFVWKRWFLKDGPVVQVQCPTCGYELAGLETHSGGPGVVCPECGRTPTERPAQA